MKKTMLLLLAGALQSCDDMPADPAIDNAKDALELAYIQRVKPPEASFVKCVYRLIDNRDIVRCGISFGTTKTEKNGYWEMVSENGHVTGYAMNGKALRALDSIGSSNEFKSGAGVRTPLNTENTEKVFNN